MSIKFSQFTIETSPSSVSYLVGYYGGMNVQITPDALLGSHVPYTGATSDVLLGTHSIWANAFKILGGTNQQFLKADGTLDNNVYLTQNDLPTTLTLYATTAPSGINGYFKLVNTIDDPDYNTIPVDINTGEIITTDQFIAGLITSPNQISGNPGIFNITTIGNIRREPGTPASGTATFFYRIYKRDNVGNETLVCTSDPTLPVGNGVYAEFQSSGLFNDGIFGPTDYIVVKYYANRVPGGTNPFYQFEFGGDTPVRTIVPIPTSAIPNISLDDISNVYIDTMTLSNGNTLVYDSMSQLWKNAAGGGGGIQNNCESFYIPWSYGVGSDLQTSAIYYNGSSVCIGTQFSPSMSTLEVNGSLAVSGLATFTRALLSSNAQGKISNQYSVYLISTGMDGFNDNLSIGNAYPSYNSRLYIEEGFNTFDGALRIVANNSTSTNDIVRVVDGSSNNLFSIGRKGNTKINSSGMYFGNRSVTLYVEQDMDSTDGVMALFAKNYSPLLIGIDGDNIESLRIEQNGDITNTNGVYGSPVSDIRLKENIVPSTSKLDDILKLNVVNYNFKNKKDKKVLGFIAQEFEQVFPSLVTSRDTRQYDEHGNVISGYEDSRGLKVGMEFAILTKAIQEQQAQIEELKQLINK